jgi:hypothetical protein
MHLDRRDQEVSIVGTAIIDFVVDDDLVLGLLQLDHLAELVGLGRLALANDLGRGLEQAEKLVGKARVATKDARPRLLHHLLYAWHHRIDFKTQAFQRDLLDDGARPLDAIGNLLGEPLRLTDHPAG